MNEDARIPYVNLEVGDLDYRLTHGDLTIVFKRYLLAPRREVNLPMLRRSVGDPEVDRGRMRCVHGCILPYYGAAHLSA